MPSSVLLRYCIHVVHRHTYMQNTYVHKVKRGKTTLEAVISFMEMFSRTNDSPSLCSFYKGKQDKEKGLRHLRMD